MRLLKFRGPVKSFDTVPHQPIHDRRDPFRLADWNALPDVCFIDQCAGEAIKAGPVFLRDGSIAKACLPHWEGIHAVLGSQIGFVPPAKRGLP